VNEHPDPTTTPLGHTRPPALCPPGPAAPTAAFPLLAEPDRYVACPWDLTAEHDMRRVWIDVFRHHWPKLVAECKRQSEQLGEQFAVTDEQLAQAGQRFAAYLDAAESNPDQFGRLTIYQVCLEREKALRDVGIADPYHLAKSRETEAALKRLPDLLASLDAMPERERVGTLMRGVFAGNIFDLGATQTVDRFTDGPVDFHAVLDELKPRPWLFDGLDAWTDRLLEGPPHKAACVFIDNAGPDITLGMLPLIRSLVMRSTQVIVAANTTPALNDVTISELDDLLHAVAAFDDPVAHALDDDQLLAVPSGNGAPLIDLNHVSPVLVEEVQQRGVDLVILEGMGRGVESNIDARFTCESLNLAMIKEQGVATAVGGELYDLVMRYETGR